LALTGTVLVTRAVLALAMLSPLRLRGRVRVGFRMFSLRSESVIVLGTAAVAAVTAAVAAAAAVIRAFVIFLNRVGNVSRSSGDHAGTGARLSRVDRSLVVTVRITIDL